MSSNFHTIQPALIEEFRQVATRHIGKISEDEMFVIVTACKLNNVSKYVVFAKRRYDEIILTRNMAIKRMMELFNGSLNHYSRIMWLVKSDHTTTMNSLKRFKDDYDTNEDYRAIYDKLVEKTKHLEKPKDTPKEIEINVPLQRTSPIKFIEITYEDGTKIRLNG